MGELLAMKWGNIDWNRQHYAVREILTRKRGVWPVGFGEPKTEESKRPVDLSPATIAALAQHKTQQAKQKLAAGATYQDVDSVFATAADTPLDHKNVVHRQFHAALEAADGFASTICAICAAMLIDQGESPKYIQRQLRHASIETTFNRYGHLFPDKERAAMQRLDAVLFGRDRGDGSALRASAQEENQLVA